jgi:hypothetical protein
VDVAGVDKSHGALGCGWAAASLSDSRAGMPAGAAGEGERPREPGYERNLRLAPRSHSLAILD